MYDARTVVGRYIVTGDDAKRTLARIDPREELLIVDAHEVKTLDLCGHFIGHELVALDIAVHGERCGLGIEKRGHEGVGHHYRDRFARIGIVGAYDIILYLRTHGKRGVGGKCPWSCGPGQEVGCAPLEKDFSIG